MGTKIKITEAQLKNLIKGNKENTPVVETKVDEKPAVNESIEKIKSVFKRFK